MKAGWVDVPLFEICNPKQWPTISSSELIPRGYPVYGANGRIGYYSTYNHEEPTILVTCRGATCGSINVCEPRSYVTGNSMALDDLDKSRVEIGFLRHALIARGFRDAITGTAQPQITRESLRHVSVSLPSLGEQRRIADILDKAETIRRRRTQAIALTEDLLRSTFLEMFGDPVTNPKGWPVRTLGSISTEMRYGSSEKCDERPVEGGLPVLRIPNIVGGEIDWTDLKYACLPPGDVERLLLHTDDLLFVRSNGNPEYIARCAVFDGKASALFASYLIRVRILPGVSASYVQSALSMPSYRAVLTQNARTTAGNYNISTEGLRSLSLPIPDGDVPKAFDKFKRAIRSQQVKLGAALEASRDLFNSLVDRAFRGELTKPNSSGKAGAQLPLFE